jgi:hypothetical protein
VGGCKDASTVWRRRRRSGPRTDHCVRPGQLHVCSCRVLHRPAVRIRTHDRVRHGSVGRGRGQCDSGSSSILGHDAALCDDMRGRQLRCSHQHNHCPHLYVLIAISDARSVDVAQAQHLYTFGGNEIRTATMCDRQRTHHHSHHPPTLHAASSPAHPLSCSPHMLNWLLGGFLFMSHHIHQRFASRYCSNVGTHHRTHNGCSRRSSGSGVRARKLRQRDWQLCR